MSHSYRTWITVEGVPETEKSKLSETLCEEIDDVTYDDWGDNTLTIEGTVNCAGGTGPDDIHNRLAKMATAKGHVIQSSWWDLEREPDEQFMSEPGDDL